MDLIIKDRIKALNNLNAVTLFFNLLNTLISTLGLTSDDEKLAINVRSKTKKRISVNLNSRLVLAIRENEGQLTIMFMINEVDSQDLDDQYSFVNKWPFRKETPQAYLVEISYQELAKEKNTDLINFWLRSCQQYAPRQVRSQYRANHSPELYKMATEPIVLQQYLANPGSENILNNMTTYKEAVDSFRESIKNDSSVLKDFLIQDVKGKNWVWISDSQRKIGDLKAHYEIHMDKKKILHADLHFESLNTAIKDLFHRIMPVLPDKLEWIKWQGSKSIRFKEGYSLETPGLNEKLRDAFLYMEENLGDRVRSILDKNLSAIHVPQISRLANIPLNQILFGPPGTGKTYNTINKALEILGEITDGVSRVELKKVFDKKVADGQIVFTTFHQSMSYEDFIEGIKPKSDNEKVLYEIEEGIFKSICNKARPSSGNFEEVIEAFKKDISEADGKAPLTIKSKASSFDVTYRGTNVFYVQPHNTTKENPWYPVNILNIRKAFESGSFEGVYNPTYVREIIHYLSQHKYLVKGNTGDDSTKPYVLIIDEINRGNVSQIFGELITLIEEDKRLGRKEQLEVMLPYSKEKFGVPANLFLIGTMNTADRSVEALDTALRRRFSFVEMPPHYELPELAKKVDDYKLSDILKKINRRIEKLLGKDNLIGHSYFLEVKDAEGLRIAFQNKIIPLLQEYFYGDYGKIGLVLGDGFFADAEDTDEKIFADFRNYDTSGLAEKEIYQLVDLLDKEQVTAGKFKGALDKLMA